MVKKGRKTESRPQQKADQVYELIRHSIIMLEMQPGASIREKSLCSKLSVSRTPVREAIQRLAEEGLVNVVPHSGTYVSRISSQVAEEGFIIRRALEIESVRRACLRYSYAAGAELDAVLMRMHKLLKTNQLDHYLDEDDRLHSTIAKMSGLPRIWKFITMAKVHLDRMRQLSAPVPGHLATVTEQHVAIVAALRSGKPDQAELAMRIHLESSFEVMTRLYQQETNMFASEEAE
jgi:DNA-binding GntR family transcriptional regulator